MTVGELIEKLKKMPPDIPVMCDYENIVAAVYEVGVTNDGREWPVCFLMQEE